MQNLLVDCSIFLECILKYAVNAHEVIVLGFRL